MSARDHYSTAVKSPRCGKRCEIHWSEHERPSAYSGNGRRLEFVPPGFFRGTHKDAEGDPEILCADCLIPART